MICGRKTSEREVKLFTLIPVPFSVLYLAINFINTKEYICRLLKFYFPLPSFSSLTKLLGLGSQRIGLPARNRHVDRGIVDRAFESHSLRAAQKYVLFGDDNGLVERIFQNRRRSHHVLHGSEHRSEAIEILGCRVRGHHPVRRSCTHGFRERW